jgi:hypothetical protein
MATNPEFELEWNGGAEGGRRGRKLEFEPESAAADGDGP